MRRLRRGVRTLGAPLRALLIGLIRLYRATVAGWFGGQCRFHPTCSDYAEQAIRARGAVAGAALGAWRVLRCHPFSQGGVDPAPAPLPEYDNLILGTSAERAPG
jgi:uncharacterized protein